MGCGDSKSKDKKKTTEFNANPSANASLAAGSGVTLQRIDHDGFTAAIQFNGEDAKKLSDLLNGDVMNAGMIPAESAGINGDIIIVCIAETVIGNTTAPGNCSMNITSSHGPTYVKEISHANRSFELVITNKVLDDYEEETLEDFIKYFNFDSASDFEYKSTDSKFKILYSASKNEMTITFKD